MKRSQRRILRQILNEANPRPAISWPLTLVTWLVIAALIKYLI